MVGGCALPQCGFVQRHAFALNLVDLMGAAAIFQVVMSVDKSTLDQLRIERKPERDGAKSPWLVLVVLLFIFLALAAGFYWWRGLKRTVEVTTAVAVELSKDNGRTVLNASGYVTARRDATVSSKVTGKVIEVTIEEGMTVEEGQVLARLDASNIQASLSLSQAQLKVAQTAVEETKVRLEEARLELGRTSSLVKDGVATASQLDAARAEAGSLQARLDRQREEITVAERQIGLWRQELEDRIIRAPFAGVVVSKDAQAGEMISPVSAGGGFTRTGICTLVDMKSLEIEVDVNENFINRVQPGQAVEATLDAYAQWKIPCKVIAIIPTADRQKATVKVRIGFDQLDSKILPDMGVKVAFRDSGSSQEMSGLNQVSIPKPAVRRDQGREVVYLVRDGRLERRVVTVGNEIDGRVQVLAGINAGERVVIEGPTELSDGQVVVEKTK